MASALSTCQTLFLFHFQIIIFLTKVILLHSYINTKLKWLSDKDYLWQQTVIFFTYANIFLIITTAIVPGSNTKELIHSSHAKWSMPITLQYNTDCKEV